MPNRIFIPLVLTALWLTVGLAACGGSGGSGGGGDGGEVQTGTGTGDAATDALATLDTVDTVVSASLNVSTPPTLSLPTFKDSEQHVHCGSGGPAVVTGDISGDDSAGTFELSVSFEDCEGVDGDLGFTGSYQTESTTRTFTVAFSGSVGGSGCLLETGSLTYIFTVDTDLIAAPETAFLQGTLSGTCTEPAGTATLSCDWSGSLDADDSEALSASCSCSGDGC